MHKTKLSASITSIVSIKSLNPLIDEINEIAKQLGVTTKELKKAYEIAETKDQVLEALKVVDSAKQQLPDKTKELCSNLNDNTICITYLFAKKIGKYLSPYLLQNASEN